MAFVRYQLKNTLHGVNLSSNRAYVKYLLLFQSWWKGLVEWLIRRLGPGDVVFMLSDIRKKINTTEHHQPEFTLCGMKNKLWIFGPDNNQIDLTHLNFKLIE